MSGTVPGVDILVKKPSTPHPHEVYSLEGEKRQFDSGNVT